MVGDPSGRSEERNLLDDDTLDANVAAIKAQMARIVDFDDGRAVLVDNRDWTAGVTLLDFLRDVGKHVTVNQMLARESVKARLASEHGISYTEFSYMLLQAHDYLHLHRDLGVELQIGGSDQWGNILSGIDLVRRVTGADGPRAVVAAAHGARRDEARARRPGARIWLDPARTSPYQFFQHWMQTDDRQVGEFLAKFTLLAARPTSTTIAAAPRAPRAAGRPAAPGRRGHRAWCTARRRPRRPSRPPTCCSAASPLERGPRRRWRSWRGRCPPRRSRRRPSSTAAPTSSTLLVATGLASSKGDARRSHRPGRGVGQRAKRVGAERLVGAGDVLHGRYVLLRKGKRQLRAAGRATGSDAGRRNGRDIRHGGAKFASGAVHCGCRSAAGEIPGQQPSPKKSPGNTGLRLTPTGATVRLTPRPARPIRAANGAPESAPTLHREHVPKAKAAP